MVKSGIAVEARGGGALPASERDAERARAEIRDSDAPQIQVSTLLSLVRLVPSNTQPTIPMTHARTCHVGRHVLWPAGARRRLKRGVRLRGRDL